MGYPERLREARGGRSPEDVALHLTKLLPRMVHPSEILVWESGAKEPSTAEYTALSWVLNKRATALAFG